MGASSSIMRLTEYYRRHGFRAAIRRAALALKRALFASRMVVFYCDLDKSLPTTAIPKPFKIERVTSEAALSQQDLDAITSIWNPKLARQRTNERFAKGASLWLIKAEDQLAGYGWTLRGYTIEPYFFPVGPDDVHLFDFHVFAQFRGQGINPLLVISVLRNLATDSGGRAFIEAAEWNEAQLSSLRKTPFRQMGLAMSVAIGGFRLVHWDEKGSQGTSKASGSYCSESVPAASRGSRGLHRTKRYTETDGRPL